MRHSPSHPKRFEKSQNPFVRIFLKYIGNLSELAHRVGTGGPVFPNK
jgi:hypothetical protein